MTPPRPPFFPLLPLLIATPLSLPTAASAASTLAASASSASPTVCGVEEFSGTVYCAALTSTSNTSSSSSSPVAPSHACALRRPNHTAVCWSLGGPTTTLYEPALGITFQFLVAGGNYTCGVVYSDYSVYCWSAGVDATLVPLPRIRPGICVSDESACPRGCGSLPQSQQFCGGSGVICNALCDNSSRTPAPPPASPPPPPPAPSSSNRRVSKAWIAFCVVGAVGGFAGLTSIVYCLVFGFCSNKRVHNSVQPNLSATAAGAGSGDKVAPGGRG